MFHSPFEFQSIPRTVLALALIASGAVGLLASWRLPVVQGADENGCPPGMKDCHGQCIPDSHICCGNGTSGDGASCCCCAEDGNMAASSVVCP